MDACLRGHDKTQEDAQLLPCLCNWHKLYSLYMPHAYFRKPEKFMNTCQGWSRKLSGCWSSKRITGQGGKTFNFELNLQSGCWRMKINRTAGQRIEYNISKTSRNRSILFQSYQRKLGVPSGSSRGQSF